MNWYDKTRGELDTDLENNDLTTEEVDELLDQLELAFDQEYHD